MGAGRFNKDLICDNSGFPNSYIVSRFAAYQPDLRAVCQRGEQKRSQRENGTIRAYEYDTTRHNPGIINNRTNRTHKYRAD